MMDDLCVGDLLCDAGVWRGGVVCVYKCKSRCVAVVRVYTI